MACLGYTLSVLPVNEIMEYLDVLLSPHIEQLLRVGTMEVIKLHLEHGSGSLNLIVWRGRMLICGKCLPCSFQPTVAAKSTILVKIEMLTWLVGSLNIYWETDDEEAEPRPEKPKPQGPQPVRVKTIQLFDLQIAIRFPPLCCLIVWQCSFNLDVREKRKEAQLSFFSDSQRKHSLMFCRFF